MIARLDDPKKDTVEDTIWDRSLVWSYTCGLGYEGPQWKVELEWTDYETGY